MVISSLLALSELLNRRCYDEWCKCIHSAAICSYRPTCSYTAVLTEEKKKKNRCKALFNQDAISRIALDSAKNRESTFGSSVRKCFRGTCYMYGGGTRERWHKCTPGFHCDGWWRQIRDTLCQPTYTKLGLSNP